MAGMPIRRARRLAKKRRRNPWMQSEVYGPIMWWIVDGTSGGATIPVPDTTNDKSKLGDYYEGREIWEAEKKRGYGVRLQAPGYLDATDWEFFTSKSEALKRAHELDREEAGED